MHKAYWLPTVALVSALCLLGCAQSSLHLGMKLVSVDIVPARDVPRFVPVATVGGDDRKFLHIRFSVDEGLLEFSKRHEYNITSIVSACLDGKFNAGEILQGDSGVYDGRGRIEPVRNGEIEGRWPMYDLYVFLRSVPSASGSNFSYDLMSDARDVCIQLRGGNMLGAAFASDVLVISKSEMFQAIR